MPKRLIKILVGGFLIVLGVISGFIPILQGWIFIGLGLLILSEEVPLLKKYRLRLEQKYPKQFQKAHEYRVALMQKMHRLFRRNQNSGDQL
jgi:uncharacterized membrane protein YbaN (DUF454 family)